MRIRALLPVLLLVVAAAGGCRKKDQAPLTPQPPPELADVVVKQAEQTAPGAEQVGEIYSGTAYREDQLSQWQVVLDAGKCYYLSSAGDGTVRELYINAWDPGGSRMVKERNGTPRIIGELCTKQAGMHKVEVKVTRGHGHYMLGVFSKDAPPPPPPEPEAPPPPPPGANLGPTIERLAAETAPGAMRVGELLTGRGEKTEWFVALEKGKCYWFIGAGDENVKRLYIYLWDQKNDRITESKAESSQVSVGHCPQVSGMFKVQAALKSGNGAYKVGVYGKAQ